jgi:hypothetical protein
VTALPPDDCSRLLRRGARRDYQHRLAVRIEGRRISLILAPGRLRRGQNPMMWLLRFEGELTPVSTGTRVQGVIMVNRRLESALALPGVLTGLCAAAGLVLGVGFVSILAGILLALLASYYVLFRRIITGQSSDLLRWLYESLMLPQGWTPLPDQGVEASGLKNT